MIPERRVILDSAPGVRLEGFARVPAHARVGVVVCHPHPLYGGDMDNPVVQCIAGAAAARGLATLRFNFRGVGGSTGVHDAGRGEGDDAACAVGALAERLGVDARIALAGYSFGALVAAACARAAPAGLALVAPPLAFRDVDAVALAALARPVLVVAGQADEHCPPSALARLRAALPKADVRALAGVDHFFADGLDALAHAVGDWAAAIAVVR